MYGGQRIRAAHTALIAVDSPDFHPYTEALLRNYASWRRHDRSFKRNWTASEPPDVPSTYRGVGCARCSPTIGWILEGGPHCMRAPLAHAQPRRTRHHAK